MERRILIDMYQGKRIAAVLLMAGAGERFQEATPKQFLPLDDKPLYAHALTTLQDTGFFDEIVLVCHPGWMSQVKGYVIAGGKTRQESSYLGLRALRQKPDIVLVHDAARPFITAQVIEDNLRKAIETGAADTCIPSADTLVYAPEGTITQIPERSHFLRGQTPQTFHYSLLLQAHEKALQDGVTNSTDDCRLVLRLGHPISVVLGHEENLKITTSLDLLLAEYILKCKAALHSS